MVDEVRPPAAAPGRLALPALGLAVLLLFGYVGTHRYPVEVPRPPVHTPEETFDDGLPRVTGARTAGPEGLRLLVSGPYPQVLDAHSGRGGPVPGLRLSRDEGARLQPVPGGLVATVGTPTTVRQRSVLLPAAGRRPVLLGEDVRVTPARRGGDLLVSSYRPGGTSVLVTGRSGAVRSYWAQPGLVSPLRDTAAGLLVSRAANAGVSGGDLALVDAGTGVLRRRLAAGRIVVAVGPTSVAHFPASCGRGCPLTVTALATGRSREYRMPDEGTPSRGELSPDGRLLALGFPGQYLNGRLTVRPGFAAVLDLATGELRRVAGVETPAERTADLSWWGRDRLVLGVWWDDRGRVALWSLAHPADPVQVLEVEPPGSYQFSSVTAMP
ncbi:MAG: hypothetical protein ACJ73E_04865 [Mycobacteriales bacterium]